MRLALALALPLALGFDFSAFFHGQRHGSDDDAGGSKSGACSGYLCNFPEGPCVRQPADCKCREPQHRCVHGPSGAWSCVNSVDACKKLTKALAM